MKATDKTYRILNKEGVLVKTIYEKDRIYKVLKVDILGRALLQDLGKLDYLEWQYPECLILIKE